MNMNKYLSELDPEDREKLRKMNQARADEVLRLASTKDKIDSNRAWASLVNQLANIIIDAAGKDGYISSNDLDLANDAAMKAVKYL